METRGGEKDQGVECCCQVRKGRGEAWPGELARSEVIRDLESGSFSGAVRAKTQ